ncbi:MAG TPA: RNA polymerase subunit sigma-32 [Ramlibacter sp.]|nr:RNA polymerase subunit sigma-32 [Ramlibacter sp.]
MSVELDKVMLSFALWEQARRELRATEEALLDMRLSHKPVSTGELKDMEQTHANLRRRADLLLGQAIDALRAYRAAGHRA